MNSHSFRSTIISATMFVVCCCFILFVIVATISFLQSRSITFYDSKIDSLKNSIPVVRDTVFIRDTVIVYEESQDVDSTEIQIIEE